MTVLHFFLRRRVCPYSLAMTSVAVLLLLTVGCRSEPAAPDFVARVGSAYLTRSELDEMLAALPPRQDSVEARGQVVEQWVTNQLLYQEALERGLDEDPEVQRQLEASRQSVLVSALILKLYEESPATPAPSELQAYFERNKEQLRLLEPFVRVRYLATHNADDAAAARRALQQAPEALQDSVFQALIRRHATDEQVSRTLAETYVAESRLFTNHPPLREALARLRPSQIAPVIAIGSTHHVLQLIDRVPAGTIPEPAWIEEELTRRVLIGSRKQLYARQVQRLRTEALAREDLEIR